MTDGCLPAKPLLALGIVRDGDEEYSSDTQFRLNR